MTCMCKRHSSLTQKELLESVKVLGVCVMSSATIDSDLVVVVQAQLDQAARGGRGLVASEQRYAGVFFAHLQPPLVAVDQPLQPLTVHLH